MHKTWTWSITGANLRLPHEPIFEICTHAGLSGIEGFPPLFPDASHSALEETTAAYRDGGLGIDSFHLPLGAENDIASFYETDRAQAVDVSRHWMECSAALGSRVVIQHPTTSGLCVDVEGVDNYLRQLDKSLQTLLPIAEQLNLTIALENLPPRERAIRFSARPEHFELLSREFDHPNLGFCLDTGHALMSGGNDKVAAFLDAMAPRMAAFHLADNAGDRDSHLAPGHGLVDWSTVFRKAAQIEFEHPMCIETPPFAQGHPDYSLDAWRQMVVDTDVLVEKALAE